MNRWILWAVVAGMAASGSGCAMFRAKVSETDPDKPRHLSTGYDYTDLKTISERITQEFLNSPFLESQTEPPVMMIAGVQNRTAQYVDGKNLTDRIRTMIFPTGRVRFINEARRDDLMAEQGFSAANATPETQVAVGRQLGARYMMSGSLTEMKDRTPRQVRVSKTEIRYYKLTFEVTDLESNEISWIHEVEFAREARLPLIGW
jgi:penicillin-binding protein activator